MARIQGQNFRVGVLNGTVFKVYGMATTCSITRSTQTEDASTKDDTGLASKPDIMSKGTQIQVESLNVLDTAAILTAIKSLKPLTLMWDETDAADNQTAENADFSRKVSAYLNDASFNFNDRENSAKSLQFTGTGPVETVSDDITTDLISVDGTLTKGQFVRLFLSDAEAVPGVIAAAKQLTLHVSVSLNSATTKDTEGDYEVQEPTGISYDITSNALVRSADVITSTVQGMSYSMIQEHYEDGDLMYWQIANVSGPNQRTKGTVIASGRCYITQLQTNSPNKQSVDYTASLTGYGDYTVGA